MTTNINLAININFWSELRKNFIYVISLLLILLAVHIELSLN